MSNLITVVHDDDGSRLDNFLIRKFNRSLPKSYVHKIIRTGQVRINGKRAKSLTKVVLNDTVRIPPFLDDARKTTSAPSLPDKEVNRLISFLQNQVLYEDKGVLIINKPSGLAVHGGSGVSMGIIETLRCSEKYRDLHLVHRLDKATSGCLILAKKRSYLRKLHEYLREGKNIKKQYIAMVNNVCDKKTLTIEASLKKIHDDSGQWRVVTCEDGDGRAAKTKCKLKQELNGASLVDLDLYTGRTHQIRVHLCSVGLPIIGDTKYGNSSLNQEYSDKLKTDRLFLHASKIFVKGWDDVSDISVEAPMPKEFTEAVKILSD